MVWWTEYVLRHGGAKHLRTPAANVSWAEYYMLNYVLAFFGGFILLLLAFLSILFYIIKALGFSKSISSGKNRKLKKR
jgi:glucuronosyltransferase